MLKVRGFTLIELLITISLATLLALLAMPSFGEWIQSARVRTSAESLQTGLRLAQAEAVRRSRQVVFSLTNAAPGPDAVVAEDGRNWSIQTVSAFAGDPVEWVRGGTTAESGGGVTVTGPAVLCFNSMGRLVENAATGLGSDCDLDAGQLLIGYDLASQNGTGRPLRVTVSLGGQVRLCDPARDLATAPDGCPQLEED